ncbi:MAG: Ppx/GppA phosphatase family protein [Thermodesulfovibrionia bacterium]
MKDKPLAGIDIGTNTFRLLIANIEESPAGYMINEIDSERVIIRLGEGLSDGGLLRWDVMDRAIETLKDFRKRMLRHNVSSFYAVGTSALREAINKDVFIKRAIDEAGIDVRIIDEKEEARLTSIGMTMDIREAGSSILIDIGGGSTEFIFMKDNNIEDIRSIRLGVVYLTERYMRHDPPTDEEIMDMTDEIARKLEDIKGVRGGPLLIGTAGTITTISAISQGLDVHSHERIHKSRVSLDFIERLWDEIKGMEMSRRAVVYPILRDRRMDIIVPGVLILKMVMVRFNFKEILVSDNGLREGIIIELYRTER